MIILAGQHGRRHVITIQPLVANKDITYYYSTYYYKAALVGNSNLAGCLVGPLVGRGFRREQKLVLFLP